MRGTPARRTFSKASIFLDAAGRTGEIDSVLDRFAVFDLLGGVRLRFACALRGLGSRESRPSGVGLRLFGELRCSARRVGAFFSLFSLGDSSSSLESEDGDLFRFLG